MNDVLRTFLDEPRAPDPPKRSAWDWVLVAVLVTVTLLEVVFSSDVAWRPFWACLSVAAPFALLWRRSHTFVVTVIVFSLLGLATAATVTATDGEVGFGGAGFTGLILTYALFRWASGREAAVGLLVVLTTVVVPDLFDSSTTAIDTVAVTVVLLLVALFGEVMRHRSNARHRAIERAQVREREQLARELHDTVAHHVSAIAIQAQAGRALAATQPDAATDALKVIEEAASRTLSEMRKMVSALRAEDRPESTPLRGLTDVSKLAHVGTGDPAIDVDMSGDLDDLGPSMEASLYRIAQESITNSRRHARHATRVSVHVHGSDDAVRLTVADDGDPVQFVSDSGFGLVGMTERATLLGGRLAAGPAAGRGWVVDAVLPREWATS